MRLNCSIILISILFSSCYEVYEPDVNSHLSILTVDGLFNDTEKPYCIQLQKAIPGDFSGMGTPVSGANVIITDDLLHKYRLSETITGNYVPDSNNFTVRPGRKYSLGIKTADGNQYESSSQELIPNKDIDKITGRVVNKFYVWKNQNEEYVRTENEGIETFIDFCSDPIQPLAFKFNVSLLIEYTFLEGSANMDPLKKKRYYAWLKLKLNENINITKSEYQNKNHEIVAHPLPFFSIEKSWYSLEPDLYRDDFKVLHWILIVDQFRLNADSYNFYKEIREQLAAEDKIFSPLADQVNGNIRCTNYPEKLVLGNFEVSSKVTITYLLTIDWLNNNVFYKRIPNLINIPDEGAVLLRFLPDWWII